MREGKKESVTHNMHHDRLQIGQVPPQDGDPSWDLLQLPVLSVSLCLDLGCGNSRDRADSLCSEISAGHQGPVAEMPRGKLAHLVEKQLGSGHWADLGDIPV